MYGLCARRGGEWANYIKSEHWAGVEDIAQGHAEASEGRV